MLKTTTITISYLLLINSTVFSYEFDREDYCEVLKHTVKFYGAQRCGDTGNWLLTDNLYGDCCHMDDGPDFRSHLDLTGGWHDAGDFIKFTLTIAWSAYVLLKGYEIFPKSYQDLDSQNYSGTPDGIPDILNEVKIATDYLIKCHPDDTTMIVRVGGSQDHNYWVTSPYQSTLPVSKGGGKRPVYNKAKADICGICAAALALMSNLYRIFNEDYADSCLDCSLSLYHLAENRPGTTDDPDDFYEDSSWKDDMLCAAIELFKITQADSLWEDSQYWNSGKTRTWWCPDWSNHWDLARHSLAKAGDQNAIHYWKKDVDAYINRVSNDTHIAGLAYFADWGSLRSALNAAFSAALLFDITGNTKYRDFTISQVEYAMGENEYNRSFIVGWGKNPPSHPHHANAYGYEALDWDLSKDPKYTLFGALVGGPTTESYGPTSPGYEDDIHDYVGNEVSIDYNAGLVGSVAMIIQEFSNTSVLEPNKLSLHSKKNLIENYPNPFNNFTQIHYTVNQKKWVTISVYNLLGKKVKTLINGKTNPGHHAVLFNAEGFPSGIYYIHLQSKVYNETKKIIIMQ